MEQLEASFRSGFLNPAKDMEKSSLAMREGSKGVALSPAAVYLQRF
jgi:hypothetical protein